MNTYTYAREWDWGGYAVTKSQKGWVVEGWSRVQGNCTNYRHLVKPFPGMDHDADLDEDWNEWTEKGEVVAERAIEHPDKVLNKGWIVE